MAQLKDLLVNGVSRFIGDVFANKAQLTSLEAPTTDGGSTYEQTNGKILRAGSSSIYWGGLAAADIPNLDASKITSGTLPVARGGTGQTSIANIQAGKDGDGNTISSTYLKKSGGTMTGALTLSGAPTADLHAATKKYVDDAFAANDAMIFKGTISGGSTGNYGALTGAANRGWTYKVDTAGKINGVAVEIGDILICLDDNTAAATSSDYATVQTHWVIVQNNVDGAVFKSSNSFTDGKVIIADGTNGKVKASSYSLDATVDSGTANRMAYYDTDYSITSAGHYVDDDKVSIGSTNAPATDEVFYVSGNSRLKGILIQGSSSITNANVTGDHAAAFNEASAVTGQNATAFGYHTTASGSESIAFNSNTTASGNNSAAFNDNTVASGNNSAAFGYKTSARGEFSFAEGEGSGDITVTFSGAADATSYTSTVEISSNALNYFIGYTNADVVNLARITSINGTTFTTDKTLSSTALTNATGIVYRGVAYGKRSHVEGSDSITFGKESHAEGDGSAAIGDGSHAEGGHTQAAGKDSHAEGYYANASGAYSHAEGRSTVASGAQAHAAGRETVASATNAHAEGIGTIARGNDQYVFGRYNVQDSSSGSSGVYVEIVGKGTADNDRSNARTLDWSGNETLAGNFLPMSTGQNLGSSSYRWAKLYIGTADSYGSNVKGIYWNNGVPAEMTHSLNATISSGTAQYGIAYYSTTTNIISTAQGTNGALLTGKGANAPAWKASANGAVYATSANGDLQWGTLPIAQGGTGNTSYAANRLIYSESTSKLSVTGHYADATSIAINSTTIPTPPTGYPTYNLYINGDARSSGDLYFEGTNNKLAAFKLTTVGTVSRANIDMGWDWEKLDGAGAAFRSTDPNLAANQIGRFVLFARTTADDTTQLVGAPTGELSWKKVSGAARIGINADANANYNLYVNGTSYHTDGIRIVRNSASADTGPDSILYIENKNSNDWGIKLDKDTNNYGLYIQGTGTELLQVGTNAILKVHDHASNAASRCVNIVGRLNLNRSGNAAYGRISFYSPAYYTWIDYMSDAANGACPTGGKPGTLGNVTGWARRSIIENAANYGWTWEAAANAAASANTVQPTTRMALSAYDGQLTLNGKMLIEYTNSWLTPSRIQIGRYSADDTLTDRAIIGVTNGNLHIDSYSGGHLYLEHYATGKNVYVGKNTAGSNQLLHVYGKMVIDPSYHTSNSYNEGMRINLSSNGWALIHFGGAAASTTGTGDGQWLVGRRGVAGTKAGAIGDFTIEEQDSTGAGLTLHKDACGATLWTSKVNDVFAFRIIANASEATIGTGYQHGIHYLVPNMGANSHAAGLIFGKAASAGNAGCLQFNWSASDNNANSVGIGFWSRNNILQVYRDQRVTVGNSTSTGSFGLANTSNTTGNGISLFNGATVGMPQYGIAFAGTATFGTFGGCTESWATYFTTSNTANRGWIFKRYVGTDANTKKGYNSASIRATDGVYFGGGVSLYHPDKNAWCGDFYINRIGTANSGDNNATRGTQGITLLRVGNNIAWPAAGTAGGDNNSTGIVRIYAENANFTDIMSQTGSVNRTFYLPNYNANMVAVHAGSNDAVGSATQPVYVAANGRVTACTAYASAAVGYLSLPRVTQDYNTLPGNNLTMIKEYSNSSANRPTNHWYHAITSKGSDSAYATQFAMGMTITRLYYRNYSGSAWSAWKQVWIAGDAVTSAVWNDYAEYRETDTMEAGRCVMEVGDDSMILSTKRLQRGCSITSDTWGFAQGETEKAKTPIAVSGRVLAYPYESREEFASHIGWPVCSGPNGTVSIMTEEEEEKYPSRIVGIISAIPDYEEWGGGENADRPPVKVNGRVWIKVK